jgi:hypothetical protein
MSLHSISVMVVTPLVLVVGAVLVLTPRDILRQPVLPSAETASAPIYTSPPSATIEIPVVEFETPVIQPASLIVVASAAEPPSGREVAATESTSSLDRRWITARGLNVRTGPTVQAELIASLPYGTPVNVLETSGTWAHVEADGVTGWLSANFLSDEDPSAN